MAGEKRKALKRATAQSINHMADAILTLSNVYQAFDEAQAEEAELLLAVMQSIDASRDAVIAFAVKAWGLDADGLQSYI